jgi:hypothetical protein
MKYLDRFAKKAWGICHRWFGVTVWLADRIAGDHEEWRHLLATFFVFVSLPVIVCVFVLEFWCDLRDLTYDEIYTYGGRRVRYPHWRFDMEYEELARGYPPGVWRPMEPVHWQREGF